MQGESLNDRCMKKHYFLCWEDAIRMHANKTIHSLNSLALTFTNNCNFIRNDNTLTHNVDGEDYICFNEQLSNVFIYFSLHHFFHPKHLINRGFLECFIELFSQSISLCNFASSFRLIQDNGGICMYLVITSFFPCMYSFIPSYSCWRYRFTYLCISSPPSDSTQRDFLLPFLFEFRF